MARSRSSILGVMPNRYIAPPNGFKTGRNDENAIRKVEKRMSISVRPNEEDEKKADRKIGYLDDYL